jgi:hypothetical protein
MLENLGFLRIAFTRVLLGKMLSFQKEIESLLSVIILPFNFTYS